MILRDWLPEILPEVKPWISSQDISIGRPWFWRAFLPSWNCIGFIVVCLTPENVKSALAVLRGWCDCSENEISRLSARCLIGCWHKRYSKNRRFAQLQCATFTDNGMFRLATDHKPLVFHFRTMPSHFEAYAYSNVARYQAED